MEKSASASETQVVSFKAGDYKDAIVAEAKRHNLSAGQWSKLVVLAALKNPPALPTTPRLNVAKAVELHGRHRVSLRLTDSEMEHTNKLMKETKTATPSKMLVSIIRSFLLEKPLYSQDEITELKRASMGMQIIGRNMNNIARNYVSGTPTEADIFTKKQLEALANDFITYSNYVNKLLMSTLKRHRIKE